MADREKLNIKRVHFSFGEKALAADLFDIVKLPLRVIPLLYFTFV
jgi:hypothetical protein